MAVILPQDSLSHAVYFAPRGRKRLISLGYQLSQRYLSRSEEHTSELHS